VPKRFIGKWLADLIEKTAAAFFELVAARRGHFRLESGHHSGLWLDLDGLFAEPKRIAPFVDNLTVALRSYSVSAVCGPLLGGAFLAQLVAHALEGVQQHPELALQPVQSALIFHPAQLEGADIERGLGKGHVLGRARAIVVAKGQGRFHGQASVYFQVVAALGAHPAIAAAFHLATVNGKASEQKRASRAAGLVHIKDQLVVIDSDSTDRTREIAEELGLEIGFSELVYLGRERASRRRLSQAHAE